MKKKLVLRNKRGSISLFVLLSILFFLVVVTSVATSSKNKETKTNSEIAQIRAIYEKDVGKEQQIYAEKIKETQQVVTERQLTVNPNGGTWRGKTQNTTIKQEEGTSLTLEDPIPPTVTFNTDGGDLEDEVESITFTEWQKSGAGTLSEDTYIFGSGNATLTARYSSITLPDATKDGYNFAGWYNGETKVGNAGISYTPDETVTLTAHWTEKQTTSIILAFIDASGQAQNKTVVLQENQTSGSVTAPEIGAYTTGWTPQYWTAGEQPNSARAVDSGGTLNYEQGNATTYYAIYQKQVEVSFNLNGASETAPTALTRNVKVNSNNLSNISSATVTLPEETPTRDGYVFGGWKSSEDNNTYNAGATYTTTAGAVMTAQWESNSSKLTVDPDGGSVTITSPTGETPETITEPKTYTQEYNTTLTYTEPTKANTTVNTTYTVTYNYNGNGTSNSTDTATKTDTTTYTFDKWIKGAGFKGTLSSETGAGTYTFPADNNITSTITATYTTSITSNTTTVTLPTPTREGYTFDGWYDGETKIDDGGATYTPTGNITLKAKWNPISYTISYNLDGGELETGETNPDSYTTETNTFTLNNPVKLGYAFAGWTGSNGNTPQTTVSIAQGSTGNKNYTANWTTAGYTVTFDPGQGGSVSPTSKTVTYNSAYGELPTPTRPQYDFIGWNLHETISSSYWEQGGIAEASGLNVNNNNRIRLKDYKPVLENTKYTLSLSDANTSRNIVFRSVWYYNEHCEFISKIDSQNSNIEFTTPSNCKYIKTVIQYSNGTTSMPLSILEDLSITMDGPVTSSTIVTQAKNHTLTAQWAIKRYTVTFDGNGGTPSEPSRLVTYNTAIGTLPTASRDNFGFIGWYTETSEGTRITESEVITADVTYHAQWVSATARIGDTYYGTLTEAIGAVPNTKVETTITLLKNTSGQFTINQKQYINFDLQNFTISNNGNASIIENSGKIWISNGTFSSDAEKNGAINNNQGGEIIMSGGNVLVTGGRQAIYNNKGTVRISGGTFSAQAEVGTTNRATLHNLASSTMIITGGTIISTSAIAVTNAGTMTIGTKDNNPDPTTLSIQGVTYGVYASANFKFFDGTINCINQNQVISSETRITEKEEGYDLCQGQAIIKNLTYKTTYLAISNTVTFDPNEGTVDPTTIKVETGKKAGILPTPTRTGYIFKGWFTAGGTEVTKDTVITEDITVSAHWAKAITITFNKNASDANIINGTKDAEEGQPIGEMPEATRKGFISLGWFTDPNDGDLITEETIAGNTDVTYYAHWKETNPAAIGETEYATLQAAIDAAGTSSTPVTITILEKTTEQLKVAAGQNIIFDLDGQTISNNGNNNVIENRGTITFTSGAISSVDASASTINNYAGGTVIVDGVNITATGERQAIYNYGGTVIIRGNSTISSNTSGIAPANPVGNNTPRGTIQNFSGGTVTIESGTIIATEAYAIVNSTNSTVTLGTKDGSVNVSSPIVQGMSYGIKNVGILNFYDGTIKGITGAVQGTITEEEENTREVNGTEPIDEETSYLTLHLESTRGALNLAGNRQLNNNGINSEDDTESSKMSIPSRVSNALGKLVETKESRTATIICTTIIVLIIIFWVRKKKRK